MAYLANPLDRFFGISNEDLQNQGLKHSQPDQHGKLQLDSAHTLTAFQARQTLEALERLKDSTFSLTCSFHFPHSPMLAPEPYYGMYPVEDMPVPVSINDPMSNSPYASSNSREKRTEYADPERIKYMVSEYYGLVTEIDDWVGKILDKLDSLGIADKTLVIFTSDHGEMLGSHGMREKNVFYEESAHIPLLLRLPGEMEAGSTVDGYVSLVDLFPTILDYLEVPAADSDGRACGAWWKEPRRVMVHMWSRSGTGPTPPITWWSKTAGN
jgi:arylsulfatase A-like enzyme